MKTFNLIWLLVVGPVVGLGGVRVVAAVVAPTAAAIGRVAAPLLVVVVILLLLSLLADVGVVVPHGVLLGEGGADLLRVASLAAVEGRAEGDRGVEVGAANVVAVARVGDELELGWHPILA